MTSIVRRRLLVLHLALGLCLGGVFALLGMTGSFLVFYPEIDRALNPELVLAPRESAAVELQPVFDVLRANFPDRGGRWRLEMPLRPDRPVMARLLQAEDHAAGRFAPLVVAVDPAGPSIIHSRHWGEYAVTWIYDLHYSLQLAEQGKVIVAVVGIAMLISVLVGVVLWMPRGRDFGRKLLPRVRAGAVRCIYDLHALFGAYGLPLTIMLVVTGVVLARPAWFEPAADRLSTRWARPAVASVPPTPDDAVRISADQAAAVAMAVFPAAGLRWVEQPDRPSDAFFVRLKQPGEPSDRFPKTYVWIDAYSGKVLAFRDPMSNSAADTFFDWLHPLHNGEAFGTVGRWIVFFAGLLPALLFATGSIRWWQKRRAARAVRMRTTARH